jgi:hypothetical protein
MGGKFTHVTSLLHHPNMALVSIFKSFCILNKLVKKRKKKAKKHIQQKLFLLRLLSLFSIQRVPLDIFYLLFWILKKLLDFISFSLAISFYIIAI